MTFRLSSRQMLVLVALTSICVTPFSFPGVYVLMGRQIWIACATQLAIALVGAGGVAMLLGRFPGASLPEVLERTLGRPAARVYLALLGAYLLLWTTVGNLQVLGRVILATVLPFNNGLLVAGAMVAAAAFAAHFGPEVVARTAEAWSLLVVPALFLVLATPYFVGDFGRLLPLLPSSTTFFLHADFWMFGLGLRGFILALALAGMVDEPRRLPAALVGGVLAAAAAVTLSMVAPYTIFDPATVALFQFPALEVFDTVRASALGLQSPVPVMLLVWFTISWTVVAATLYAASACLAWSAGLRSHRPVLAMAAVVAVILGGSAVPPPIIQPLMAWWTDLGYAIGLAGPWLLAAIAAVRAGAAAVGLP